MNSSSSSANTVDVELGASVRGLSMLLVTHALALFLVLWAMPDGPGKAAVAILVAVSWFLVRRHRSLGFGNRAIRRVRAHPDGRWQVEIGGEMTDARLLPRSVVSGPVPVLMFETRGKGSASRLIFGDEAADGSLRALRARLGESSPQ